MLHLATHSIEAEYGCPTNLYFLGAVGKIKNETTKKF